MSLFVAACCESLLVSHDSNDSSNQVLDQVSGSYVAQVDILHNGHSVYLQLSDKSDTHYIYYNPGQGWVLGTSLSANNVTGISTQKKLKHL